MIKYQRLKRILYNKIKINPTKRYLSKAETKKLLSCKVVVEEKIDGSQCGVAFKGGKPIFYTKNRHLWGDDKTPSFNGAWKWIWENYEKIEKIPKGLRICGEWVKVQHHIHYDKLPDWFVAFDVLNERTGKLLNFEQKIKVIEDCDFAMIPLLEVGVFSIDDLYLIADDQSNYAKHNWPKQTKREGIVVKNYKLQLNGKLVMQEFLDEIIDEKIHWNSYSTQKLNEVVNAKQ